MVKLTQVSSIFLAYFFNRKKSPGPTQQDVEAYQYSDDREVDQLNFAKLFHGDLQLSPPSPCNQRWSLIFCLSHSLPQFHQGHRP